MKSRYILSSKKVSRKFSGGFALFLVFTLIGMSYRPGIAASFHREARVANNSTVTTQDDGGTNGVVFPGGAITINDSAAPPTQATPYPSNITVSGQSGIISVINVTLTGFSHAFPDDVDILLKGPTGANAIILSDVGGSIAASNLTITLDDGAAASLPDAGPLTSGTFKPTNVGAGDTFPTQAPSGGSVLSVFNGTNPNGTWSLYVVDDANGQAGSISGWSLNILTATQACNSANIPISDAGGGNVGQGNPYPSNITIADVAGTVARVTIAINGLNHTEPDDLSMLLVGPTGARIVFLADVGGTPTATNINLVIDDFAAAQLPDNGGLASGTFKPTVPTESGGEVFPAPSPCAGTCPADLAAPEGTKTLANSFNGTNPNGTWSLYVTDQSGGDTGNISGGWCLTITAGPTLARFSSASATASDDGQVNVKWKTGYEVDNLGFNVYRDEAGERVRVNKQIIAGSAFVVGQGTAMSAGRTYSWRDNTSNPNAQYWVEALDINGTSTWHGPISPVRATGKSDFATQSATLSEVGRSDGATETSDITTSGVVVEAGSSGKSALKLSVKETGYYRVTQPELVAAGLSAGINPRKLQLFEDGNERPMFVQGERDGDFGASDSIEFYATAADNAFTDKRVYRLVAGTHKGLRIKTEPETNGAGNQESFLLTRELKERNVYFASLINGEQENFFGAVVAREPVTRTLALRNLAESAPDFATVEVSLQGITTSSHHVRVVLNGVDVGAVRFDGKTAGSTRIPIAQSSLREGDNSVELIAIGGDTDVSLMDLIKVSYWHRYEADNDALEFTAKAGERVTIGGFSTSAIRVIDITEAEKVGVTELAGAVSAKGNGHSVTVGIGGSGTRRLVAFGIEQMKRPVSIRAEQANDLRGKGNKADLVIITGKEFISALQPLKAHRESQGLKVVIVDIESVYDEFSFGNKNPQAIRDFLAYATSRWKVKPRFALLAGDASLDPKNYLGAGDWDIVPTKLIDTKYMEAASDEWMADFNGDGLAELAVGRLPVRTVQEMATVIRKIIGYDSASGSESVLLVADADDTFDFAAESAGLRALIPGSLRTLEIDRGVTDEATARVQLLGYLNQGQRVINYLGHGNLNTWRGEMFTSEDAIGLRNSEHLSVFVGMTCLNGYFQEAATESIAEALIKAPNGGAVAAWASTGMSDPGEQGKMNKEFYRLMFGSGKLTLGEAAMKSKAAVKDKDVRQTWVLIGDPTTRLR